MIILLAVIAATYTITMVIFNEVINDFRFRPVISFQSGGMAVERPSFCCNNNNNNNNGEIRYFSSPMFSFTVPTAFECACLLITACCGVATAVAAGRDGPESLGTALYSRSDAVAGTRNWSDDELTELRCRVAVEPLVPTAIPEDANDFLVYFDVVKNRTAKIRSTVVRKRATLMVADAIGAYLYARLLPAIGMLYYEGKVEYSTAKRLHDLMRKIK